MKKSTFLFSLIFSINMAICAQANDVNDKELPISIYTFNSFSSIHKKQHLKKLNAAFTNIVDSEMYQYSLNVKDINKFSSEFMYDDLKRYQDRKMIKDFIIEHDPISWNLHYNQQQALAPESKI